MDKIDRAKELLLTVRHAAMATVNEDGSPHNTPYFFMHDGRLQKIYWSSHPESQHSRNIERTGQLFIVLYDAQESGGLYIEAINGHSVQGGELETALTILNKYRMQAGKAAQNKKDFSGFASQRLYTADVRRLWIHGATKNENGAIVKDQRQLITIKDLGL